MTRLLNQLEVGAGLLAVSGMTMALGRWARLGLGWQPLWVLTRAAVQLGVIALLLRGVLAVPWTAAVFLLLMLTVASWTASRRLAELWHGGRAAVLGVLTGGLAALTAIFALRLLAFETRYVVAAGGIVVGNAMSAATLSGRNFLRAAGAGRDELEGWLSLGATPTTAYSRIGREAVRESLLPSLDQTRSTGLVTLPGAFVGALFGGASPAQAAQFQLVVLAGIALAMTTTGVVVTSVLGRSPYVVAAPD